MREVFLFVEDFGHEAFLVALINKLSGEYGIEVRIRPYSVRGGRARVVIELKQFMDALHRAGGELPDLLVIATDGNCQGYSKRKAEVDKIVAPVLAMTICAIPDPHVERWLLLDSAAFKSVFGHGCTAPDQKCDKDRYKGLLLEAIRKTGVDPPLGGLEYSEDLVNSMDLHRVEVSDNSISHFLKALRAKFNEWQQGQSKHELRD